MAQLKGNDTMESQMKKLILENSTLQIENKLMKDKYNRSLVKGEDMFFLEKIINGFKATVTIQKRLCNNQLNTKKKKARISELESKLKTTREEVNNLQLKYEGERSRQAFTANTEMERQVEQCKAKALSSSKELEILKSELAFTEQKMNNARQELDAVRQNKVASKAHVFHKQELESLQGEIKQLKQLLKESENSLDAESARSKDFITQVQKLTQVRDALQLQLKDGTSGGTAAEKQVASLNMRLKITEERLAQERADRSGNLSQIEEKLLSDNAKLQTKEKELERLLKRETEKTRSLEMRAKDFREQNLQLKLAMPDEDIQDYDLPQTQHTKSRNEYKKPAYDIELVRKKLENESGIMATDDNEDRILLYLWEDRHKALHCLKAWKLYLKQMELPEGDDYTESLQNALALKEEYETKMQQNEEKFETIRAEKITSDQTYKQQLSELVRERHEAFSRLQTLEDLMDALKAENESLRQGLATTTGNVESRTDLMSSGQNSESLQEEIVNLEARLTQTTRKLKAAETEVSSLRSQLKSRDQELVEALAELEEVKANPRMDGSEENLKSQRIEMLSKQIVDMKEEMHAMAERSGVLANDKQKLVYEASQIKSQLSSTQKEMSVKQSSLETNQIQQVKKLEEELEAKESEIISISSELNETKFLFQRAKEDLAKQQQKQLELQEQLKSIQQHVDQRCEMLDSLTERENDQLEQMAMVKGMMDTVNQGLDQKQAQVDMLSLQLQQANEKVQRLERQKASSDPRQLLAESNEPLLTASKQAPSSSGLRIREMEMEQDNLNAQILDTMTFSTRLQEECTAVKADLSKVKEESLTAQTVAVQSTNEQNLLERRVLTLSEENEMTAQERDMYKQEAANAELSLCEVVQRFETEGRKKYANFSTDYVDDSEEGQKLIGELHTLRLLTFAKEKENSLILDKIGHQEQEKFNLDKKYKLVNKENDQSRQDVQRITKELVLKMKENAITAELNQTLVSDRAKLEKKLEVADTQLQREKERTQKWKAETEDVFKKIDDSEQTNISMTQTLQQKDSLIASLELRVGQMSTDLKQTEYQHHELQSKSEKLSEDVRNLSNVNTALECKIENKDSVVKEEQTKYTQQQEKLTSATQKLESLKHEQNLLLNNLTSERKVQEKLKDEIKALEENERQLKDKMSEMNKELDMSRGQLVAANESIKQIKDQKDIILKDYQDSCRRLGEKESTLQEMKKKSDEEIIQVKHQTMLHSQNMEMEKTNTDKDMQLMRSELDKMEEMLMDNRDQMVFYAEQTKELDDATRKVDDLQAHIKEQNQVASESKMLLESIRKELFSVNEENSRLQDMISKKEVAILDLRDQLRSTGESTETQVTDLKHTIEGMRSHHEYEKKTLREALNKVEDNLKASVQELRTLMEAKEQLAEQNRVHERTISDINYKLSHEVSSRNMVEDKLGQMKENVDEMKREKIQMTEKSELTIASSRKCETDNSLLRERYKTLSGQVKDLECALKASENTVKIKDEKVEGLKAEVVRQQQLLETIKQQSSNKVRKMNLDSKQQIETVERENVRLNHQFQQLSESLEQAREQLANKNKENLKHQERILELQEDVKDMSLKLKQSQDSLKQEEEMQTKLHIRFEEQESELKKLRQFLDKKANEDGSDSKGMWQEMNRVISELSRQLSFHIETSKMVDQGNRDDNLIRKLQRSLLDTEAQLNTERTLHQVTRTSLQALEDDCNRLRQTLYSMRRRGVRSEKKSKSRMEEINEIIARSQTRAQALLASGEYTLDDSFRNFPDYTGNDANFSPNASIASDTSFSSSNLGNLSFLNLSGKHVFSPKK